MKVMWNMQQFHQWSFQPYFTPKADFNAKPERTQET